MIALRELLAQIEQGRYALPEVQRPYVWRNAQIRDLLESVYRGYPIGSIIVWNIPRGVLEEYSDLFRPLIKELEDRTENFEYLVIDGQQRLVSLLLAKRGSITVYYEYGERRRYLPLYFNPRTEKLEIIRGKESDHSYWFKVSDLLNEEKDVDDLLDEKGISSKSERSMLRRKLNFFRNSVLNYSVNFYQIPESTLKYDHERDNFLEIFEKISEMFVRLNEKGTRVKMPHLILALLTAATRKELGRSFKEQVNRINSELEEHGWDIREGVIMRTYMAIATGETNFRRARGKLKNLKASEMLECLEETGRSLMHACDILSDEFNIKGVRYLKSQYLLVTLSYYIFRKSFKIMPSDVRELIHWLILASFSGRYTGRLESDLKEDIGLIREGKTLRYLEDKLPVREITEKHFDRPYEREHLTILLILLKDSYDLYYDPREGFMRLRDIDPKERRLHIHHIFPRDVLVKVYGRKGLIGNMDIETAYDHVAKITIISEDANRKIGSKRPDEYLGDLGREVLRSHYIPDNPELWKPENYYDFLQERKMLLMEVLRKLLSG